MVNHISALLSYDKGVHAHDVRKLQSYWTKRRQFFYMMCLYHLSDWNLLHRRTMQSYTPGGATFSGCFSSFSNPRYDGSSVAGLPIALV